MSCDRSGIGTDELQCDQVTATSDMQVRFSRLWTQCQRCQGSLHMVRAPELVGDVIDAHGRCP